MMPMTVKMFIVVLPWKVMRMSDPSEYRAAVAGSEITEPSGFGRRCQRTTARPTFAGSSTCRSLRSSPWLASNSSGVRAGTPGKTGRPPGSRTPGARATGGTRRNGPGTSRTRPWRQRCRHWPLVSRAQPRLARTTRRPGSRTAPFRSTDRPRWPGFAGSGSIGGANTNAAGAHGSGAHAPPRRRRRAPRSKNRRSASNLSESGMIPAALASMPSSETMA